MRRSFWAAPMLGLVGGLVLLLASAAGWVDTITQRDVGGLMVEEPASISGTTYAPAAVVFGLVALAIGALLAALRGRGRRIVGATLAGIGIAGLIVVGLGLSRAAAAGGTVTPTPFLALVAGLTILAAGWAAMRGPARPPAASRYRVEGERSADDEWSMAAEDETQD